MGWGSAHSSRTTCGAKAESTTRSHQELGFPGRGLGEAALAEALLVGLGFPEAELWQGQDCVLGSATAGAGLGLALLSLPSLV